jgi:hypothetical protein
MPTVPPGQYKVTSYYLVQQNGDGPLIQVPIDTTITVNDEGKGSVNFIASNGSIKTITNFPVHEHMIEEGSELRPVVGGRRKTRKYKRKAKKAKKSNRKSRRHH